MSNPESKTKTFSKSFTLVVATDGQVTLYGQDITDVLTKHNYPMWFGMYADTLAEYRQEDDEAESDDWDDEENDPYKVFGVTPKDFF